MRGPSGNATIVTILVVLFLTSLFALPASSADGNPLQEPAPFFRGSLANLGAVSGSAPVNNTLLWSKEVEGSVQSSPVVVDGRLFVGTMGGEVLCMNAYSGSTSAPTTSPSTAWTRTGETSSGSSPPTVTFTALRPSMRTRSTLAPATARSTA